jgi:hypothetical protein
MYNSIILSSCLFGSIYLFSVTLTLINNSLLENRKMPRKLIIINGLTFLFSGSIIIYSFTQMKI